MFGCMKSCNGYIKQADHGKVPERAFLALLGRNVCSDILTVPVMVRIRSKVTVVQVTKVFCRLSLPHFRFLIYASKRRPGEDTF